MKHVNLGLTIVGAIFMSIEIVWAIVLWSEEDCHEIIFKQYYFFKIVGACYFMYRWFVL